MSDITPTKGRVLLLGSLALNIFLAAFVLGRISMMGPHMDDHHMHEGPGHGGPGGHMGPPFFGPKDLFTADEMKDDFVKMDNSFKTMDGLRKTFAEQLKNGPVTEEQVLAHFAEIDKVMNTTKKQLQERAAKKIASLSPEDRAKFAEKMLEENKMHEEHKMREEDHGPR